jgi:transglutaminase-like putative cysteine protease
MTPEPTVRWHRDVFDNCVALVSYREPSAILAVESDVVVQHFDEAPLDFVVAEAALYFPFHYDPAERLDLIPYVTSVFPDDGQALRDWVRPFWQPGQVVETYVLLDQMNAAIPAHMTYRMREAPGVQAPGTTVAQQSGACRDLATLFMEACRLMGLAARFVSGYLHCPATEAGHGATHAWAEVYLPGAGWKGFDPTLGELVGIHHIPVAVHRHPEAIPPIAGSFVGQLAEPPSLRVEVQVHTLNDAIDREMV